MANSRTTDRASAPLRHQSGVSAHARNPRRSTLARHAEPGGANDTAPVLRRFHRKFRWDHTALEPYKIKAHSGGEFAGASRQVLVGRHGERVGFHLRYFELRPGGYTSLERHRHSHVVVGLRGRGVVQVGERNYTLGPLDAIYIGPQQPHQLRAVGRSPFGFFCIVNARRDKPRPVNIK
ncbi:MAG TPA: cupin domain-containing protein [Candidatus Binataceae bacterium]|nr:cupin domain-containing protein [Candidatus Binataceae bacterium]